MAGYGDWCCGRVVRGSALHLGKATMLRFYARGSLSQRMQGKGPDAAVDRSIEPLTLDSVAKATA